MGNAHVHTTVTGGVVVAAVTGEHNEKDTTHPVYKFPMTEDMKTYRRVILNTAVFRGPNNT